MCSQLITRVVATSGQNLTAARIWPSLANISSKKQVDFSIHPLAPGIGGSWALKKLPEAGSRTLCGAYDL